jgi:hypothetical protein
MAEQRRSRGADDVTPGERVRRRIAAEPEIELDDEELRALADEGIDPEDVRRIARERRERSHGERVSALHATILFTSPRQISLVRHDD